jgi:thiamine transport system ATP-binding protein
VSAVAPRTAGLASAAGLAVEGVRVVYEGRAVLDDLALRVGPREVVGLLGPSGSGKTTLLEVIAGVFAADAGRVSWDGADLAATPAHRRGFGLVFQDALLFPHLDVGRNIAFGLRMARIPRAEQDTRVAELLALVELPGLERRSVATLSGGEAQRVALARALAPRPRLLLLDEPFSGLDRDLRVRLAADVRALLHRVGTPAILVTHDEEEARAVADRVVRLADLQPRPPQGPPSGPAAHHPV